MRDAAPPSKPRGLGVLEKAMGLLNVVSARRAPMTFTELLQASGLPKATLHRTLATLVREGLLRHDPYNKNYNLGFRLLELAHEVWSDFDLRVAAQDDLVRLRDRLGATIELAAFDGHRVLVIASEPVDRATSTVGRRLPLHATAAGKAIAAHLDPPRQAGLLADLEAYTGRTLVDREALRAELDLTRTRGYAIEDGEHDDTFAVAAPIFDYEGRPVGAVAAVGHGADGAARAPAWSWELIAAARAIAHDAGGTAMSMSPQQPPAGKVGVEVHCVTESRSLLGEGPIWSPRDNALYWVDILAPSVHRLSPTESGEEEVRLGVMTSIAIPKASGDLLVATPRGLMALRLSDRALTPFAHPEAERTTHRYNDGKCDRRGRLWIASMDMAANANRGSLYRVEGDGTWKRMDAGFTVPNGLGFSPDGTRMYFTDTFRRTVYAYDFDLASGAVERRRPLIVFDDTDGKPDGLTVDEDGCLWIALWDGWAVARYSPEGRELMRVRMPVPRPTSCCFGGSDLATLYVTSAAVRLSEQALAAAPLSGAVFAVKVDGVRGLPETTFGG